MGEERSAFLDRLMVALQALVDAGVPTDIQELLLYGNPDRGVKPRALENAIAAARGKTPVTTIANEESVVSKASEATFVSNATIHSECDCCEWAAEHIAKLEAALHDVRRILTVPAAEYCPTIPEAWARIDEAVKPWSRRR